MMKLKRKWESLEQQKRIDPLWIISRYVVWPLFPVLLYPEGKDNQAVCLDDRFHGDVLAPINTEAVIAIAEILWNFPALALGQPRWEYLDWEDKQGDQATGTRIRLIFPYHQPITGDLSLPLDPPSSSLIRAHELAAFVETTLSEDENRNFLTVIGVGVANLEVCAKMLPVAANVGTRLWADLRGSAAPRLTADRKTALPREDVDDWPSVFEGVFQRWCGWLQGLLNRYPSQLAPGLLSAISIQSKWRLEAPATPSLSVWRLEATNRSADWIWRWFKALLAQEIARTYASNLDLDLDLDLNSARGSGLNLARAYDRDLDYIYDYDIGRDLDLDLDRNLAVAIAIACAPKSFLTASPNWTMAIYHHNRISVLNYTGWKLSLALHLLPEAFAEDLSRSFPALGVCGLKGRAGDGWLVAPGWIEWDVNPATAEVQSDSPKEQWAKRLIEQNYDLVFPLTNIPLGRLRRHCPTWRSDRSFRAIGVLAYFVLGLEKWLEEQGQKFLGLFKVPHIHALIPKPELWLKPFDGWTDTDWNACGLSALWDIKSGVVYWAEGAHSADVMKQVGQPIDKFIGLVNKPG